jgi:hypothetical protein
VEQLHRGAAPPENVWYSSIFLIIPMTTRAHMSEEQKKKSIFFLL